jgi:hypothetical protein
LSAFLPFFQTLPAQDQHDEKGITAYELIQINNDKFNRKNDGFAAVRDPLCPFT